MSVEANLLTLTRSVIWIWSTYRCAQIASCQQGRDHRPHKGYPNGSDALVLEREKKKEYHTRLGDWECNVRWCLPRLEMRHSSLAAFDDGRRHPYC